MAMMSIYSDDNRGWEKGKAYERWVKVQWPNVYTKRTLTFMEGKKAQLIGETHEGVEIKFDDRIKETNRVYIETEEKAHYQNDEYVVSGIYRQDNSRLYLVGDYERWFLFAKQHLQFIDKLDPPFLYRPPPTGTSIGFCIPMKNAKRLCLDYHIFNDDGISQRINVKDELDEDGKPKDDSWMDF